MSDDAGAFSQASGEARAIWAVPLANALEWREFDDEFLVYNTLSGQTHHLNYLAGEALRCLEAQAATAHGLVRRLAKLFEIAESHPSLQMIDHLIRELDELGLIAPSTS